MTKKSCDDACRPRWILYGAVTAAALAATVALALVSYHLWPEKAQQQSYEQGGPPTAADIPNLCGWAGEESARSAWDRLKSEFPKFEITHPKQSPRLKAQDKRVVLWDAAKIVNGGRHLPTLRQEVGDCVSFGAANAMDYLLCVQIATGKGPPQEYHHSFPPFIYGVSRVQIGGGGLGGDGSNGVWAARGLVRYGTLPADAPDVPGYSGSIARSWGRRPGPPEKFFPIAAKNLVKTAAKVERWEDVRDAIQNGYPCTIASNVGFRMQRDEGNKKLWGVPSGSWAHQMAVIGYDDKPEPCFYIMNSWGADAHGVPLDDAPPGGFWTKAAAMQRVVGQGDSFAFSEQLGFPARDWDLDILIRAKSRQAARAVERTSPYQLAP